MNIRLWLESLILRFVRGVTIDGLTVKRLGTTTYVTDEGKPFTVPSNWKIQGSIDTR